MSVNLNDLIASINNATVQLNRYIPLVIFFSGIIGNLLNIFVLSRRTLRTNPCAFFFLVSSIAGLVAIVSGLTTRLTAGWAVDLSETISWLCKLRIFVLFVARTTVVWLLVCASFDRWCSSSFNVSRRNWSSLKIAFRGLILTILFSIFLNAPLLYCYEANLIGTPARCFGFDDTCRLYTDLSYTFGTIVIPSFLMLLFGLLTIGHIRQVQRRVKGIDSSTGAKLNSPNESTATGPLQQQQQRRRTDRSLFKMLFAQVLFLILCTAPYTIYRIYITVAPASPTKPALQNALERLLFNLCTNLTYLASAMPFYIYTLCGGKVFRTELWNLLRDFCKKAKFW